jgi:hypothetical protein
LNDVAGSLHMGDACNDEGPADDGEECGAELEEMGEPNPTPGNPPKAPPIPIIGTNAGVGIEVTVSPVADIAAGITLSVEASILLPPRLPNLLMSTLEGNCAEKMIPSDNEDVLSDFLFFFIACPFDDDRGVSATDFCDGHGLEPTRGKGINDDRKHAPSFALAIQLTSWYCS